MHFSDPPNGSHRFPVSSWPIHDPKSFFSQPTFTKRDRNLPDSSCEERDLSDVQIWPPEVAQGCGCSIFAPAPPLRSWASLRPVVNRLLHPTRTGRARERPATNAQRGHSTTTNVPLPVWRFMSLKFAARTHSWLFSSCLCFYGRQIIRRAMFSWLCIDGHGHYAKMVMYCINVCHTPIIWRAS